MSFALPLQLARSRYLRFFALGFLLLATAVVISKVPRKPSAWRVKETLMALNLPEPLSPPPERNAPFIAAIFRDDGIVVPFASYANRKWSNPWGIPNPNEPQTIADLAYPWFQAQTQGKLVWQLALPSETAQSVTTSKVVQVPSHCQEVWALPSDYSKARQPEPNSSGENLGLAVNRPADARAMERVTSGSSDWMRLTSLVGAGFDRAEAAGVAKVSNKFYHPQIPPAAQRKKFPLRMLNLYQASIDNRRTIFFFEASKEYPPPATSNIPDCPNISLLIGWVAQEHEQLTLIKTDFASTNCDRKEGGPTQPLAIVRLDAKTFVVVVEYSYEGEMYVILEIERCGIRRALETYAGSC